MVRLAFPAIISLICAHQAIAVGSTNTTRDSVVVFNEIFYHASPVRAAAGTPPTFAEVEVLDFDGTWRYNLDAGAAGLPAG